MSRVLTKSAFAIGLLALYLAIPAQGASINKSIKIAAGSESDGASSVNGSISVGEGAVVSGNLKTVNGTIRVDDNATILSAATVNGSLRVGVGVKSEDLSTVNGGIRVDEKVTVRGEIEAVNGRIEVAKGSKISDDVSNVNGEIEVAGGEIGGDLSTVNGDIELSDAALVKGDLIVEKPGSWSFGSKNSRKPEIVIGPGSRVHGTLRLEREVGLYISETAEVGGVEGEMSMSDAIRFSGEHP